MKAFVSKLNFSFNLYWVRINVCVIYFQLRDIKYMVNLERLINNKNKRKQSYITMLNKDM